MTIAYPAISAHTVLPSGWTSTPQALVRLPYQFKAPTTDPAQRVGRALHRARETDRRGVPHSYPQPARTTLQRQPDTSAGVFHGIGYQLADHEFGSVLHPVVDLPFRTHLADQSAAHGRRPGVTRQLDPRPHHCWPFINRGLGLEPEVIHRNQRGHLTCSQRLSHRRVRPAQRDLRGRPAAALGQYCRENRHTRLSGQPEPVKIDDDPAVIDQFPHQYRAQIRCGAHGK